MTSTSLLPFFFVDCCLSSCNCCCFCHQRPLLSIVSSWLSHCLSSCQRLLSTGRPPPLITPWPLVVLLLCLLSDGFSHHLLPLVRPMPIHRHLRLLLHRSHALGEGFREKMEVHVHADGIRMVDSWGQMTVDQEINMCTPPK
jgi:hypothetical protein